VDVHDHLGVLMSSGFRGRVHIGATNGLTGRPVPYIYEYSAAQWWDTIQARCKDWYGIGDGDKMVWLWGVGRFAILFRMCPPLFKLESDRASRSEGTSQAVEL
jgi:phenylacetate-coenzyme A ligase PaaK-like adenylate-forming protein